MNPFPSGVMVFVEAGMKKGAVVPALSLTTAASTWFLTVPSVFEAPSFLFLEVTEHPCDPNPEIITEITANENVICFVFMVDVYNVYDCCALENLLFCKTTKIYFVFTISTKSGSE